MSRAVLAVLFLLAALPVRAEGPEIRIGSKKFTESVILGEMARILATEAGARAVHRRELGGTR
ncbi:MAG TPA: glycine betaine ABC transporter substrate-binding protein, partial [Alphaproteobacteria bacterium]